MKTVSKENNFRIKEVAKKRNMTLDDVAVKMGITYIALNKNLKTAKFATLKKIAEILNCEVVELLNVGDDYMHFDDPKTGIWLGIVKKER